MAFNLHLTFAGTTEARIHAMSSIIGETPAVVIQRALAVYDTILKCEKEGATICAIFGDESRVQIATKP